MTIAELQILNPNDGMIVQSKFDSIYITTPEGDLSILPNHVASCFQLVPGNIYYTNEGKKECYHTQGGICTIDYDSCVTIVADQVQKG